MSYSNPYSLMVTAAIADNYRADRPNTRWFALTRSSFAGQQRTGACLW
jgi:alpha-D-xyloside xylohydrolase